MKKHRIWELDAFRGICILGMVFVHLMYDLADLYRIIDWDYPAWFSIMKNYGGILFILISGTCATLGRRSVRRGLIVLAGGLIVSAVTWGMYKFFDFHKSIIILKDSWSNRNCSVWQGNACKRCAKCKNTTLECQCVACSVLVHY